MVMIFNVTVQPVEQVQRSSANSCWRRGVEGRTSQAKKDRGAIFQAWSLTWDLGNGRPLCSRRGAGFCIQMKMNVPGTEFPLKVNHGK